MSGYRSFIRIDPNFREAREADRMICRCLRKRFDQDLINRNAKAGGAAAVVIIGRFDEAKPEKAIESEPKPESD